jgi:hypothetical protein
VVCNGSAIPITTNCQIALKRLRKQDPGKLFFVDAICINQNSTNERNHQVSAMGDIYANARKVICWLGDYGKGLDDEVPRVHEALFWKHSFHRLAYTLRYYFSAKHSEGLSVSREQEWTELTVK